jgi:hypothetical protein
VTLFATADPASQHGAHPCVLLGHLLSRVPRALTGGGQPHCVLEITHCENGGRLAGGRAGQWWVSAWGGQRGPSEGGWDTCWVEVLLFGGGAGGDGDNARSSGPQLSLVDLI